MDQGLPSEVDPRDDFSVVEEDEGLMAYDYTIKLWDFSTRTDVDF